MDISFDDRGAGSPTLLCLTGWCGDRTADFVAWLPASASAAAAG